MISPLITGTSSDSPTRTKSFRNSFLPAHAGVELDERDELEQAVGNLFRAYDLDESGELSRSEFMKIEMRMCFERGEVYKEEASAFSLMDKDHSGTLDFLEFRERQLSVYQMSGMSRAVILDHIYASTKAVLLERVRMGPRYHAGIRQVLRCIFNLYDISGDGILSPEEWIGAQKAVASEIMDDLDETWVEEDSFYTMDTNHDGRLELSEYLEASFAMFEGVTLRTEQLYATLQRVCSTLEMRRLDHQGETQPLTILVQQGGGRQFQAPHNAWQDEPGEEEFDPTQFHWRTGCTVRLPLDLGTVEDIASVLRIKLQLPTDTWLSIFFVRRELPGYRTTTNEAWELGREKSMNTVQQKFLPNFGGHVHLLRGDRPGSGNVQSTLEWLAKPSAIHRLYVKNVRPKPHKLIRQPAAFFDEREKLLAKRTGQILGLDWETQLVGEGHRLPMGAVKLFVGDAFVIEVPKTDDSGEFRYVSSVFMDGTTVISRPVEENIVPHGHHLHKRTKRKAKEKVHADGSDSDEQDDLDSLLTFVCLQAGRCVFFIDVSWEDQESKLAEKHKTCAPVSENSIARIGPLEVIVEPRSTHRKIGHHMDHRLGGKKESNTKGNIMWWNGAKWSHKKGVKKAKQKKDHHQEEPVAEVGS